MDVAALMGALFNASLVIMIVATMFAAGLATTTKALGSVFKNIWLLVLVLVTAFVLRPLVGWGLAAVFSLGTASYIVMLLLAACSGGPAGRQVCDDRQRQSDHRRLAAGGAGCSSAASLSRLWPTL